MRKKRLWIAAAVVALLGGFSAYRLAFAGAATPDCPGRIICPITGEEICRDRCPLVKDGEAPDCCKGGR